MRLRKVCPQCSTVIHVRRSVCECGHAFTLKREARITGMPRVCTLVLFINPRRACARVTVLVLSVCLCVFFPYSGTSCNQVYKQQYQRLQRDTGMRYKKGFFFKTLRSVVIASFTHLE